ncbi:MAG: hypothetical protein QOD94_1981 [Alphaproteobacteria bacterium]|nr:hypothetical protein [Alphaproteobacteria bacterium]
MPADRFVAKLNGERRACAFADARKGVLVADVLPSQLANSVMAKLYDVLTNGDADVPASEDNFFSWCTPGIPVDAADFDFLTQGLTGIVRKPAAEAVGGSPGADGAAPEPLSADELERLRAQDTARLYMQTENFARLVDFVPDVTKANNEQFRRLSVQNNEGSLSEVYARVLRMRQVMQSELPAETKEKIQKFRGLLTKTTQKKNLIDDSITEVTEPSDLVVAYNQKMAAYADAVLEYNGRRIDALTAADSRAVHAWTMNASILRNKVKAAMADWVSAGYKNEYEQISAFIDQVTQKDLTLLKQQYRDDLDKARATGLASGSDFYFTSLVPGNFAKASGWSNFTFKSTDFAGRSTSTYTNKRWGVQAGASYLGIFGGRGTASSTTQHQEFKSSFNSDQFELAFEVCQVPIVRPWFRPSFLNSKTWRFDQQSPDVKDERVSDGGAPPKGLMPAYPTAIVFIRNLKLSLGHNEGFSNFISDMKSTSAGGGGYVAFGPFFLGGSGSNASGTRESQRDWGFKTDDQGLSVPGMQIAGFKCHVLPKSPDPMPNITAWV